MLLGTLFAGWGMAFGAEGHGNGKIPAPNAEAAAVPDGYQIEVFLSDLTFPTSIEFNGEGDIFVAESGYTYGKVDATPRIIRFDKSGEKKNEMSEGLTGPVNDLLWHDGKLYISHRGKISVMEDGKVRDLVTGLPSDGDHHNNQIVAGPDGKLYFGQGVATNSGVVGMDNANMGWLEEHPEFHDVSPQELQLAGRTFTTENPLSEDESDEAVTSAFHPFGQTGDSVSGNTKAGGTILRMNTDGSGLEVFAWGLRNPYGLAFASDGSLYATENGFDARGSRPIANDMEDLYLIKQGAWYGWPDFGSGIPVTESRFKPQDNAQPEFLLTVHPEVEKPLATYPTHSSITKMAISPGGAFGKKGKMFIAFFGHMAPMTGEVDKHGGHRVIEVDSDSFESVDFLTPKGHSHSGGEKGEKKDDHQEEKSGHHDDDGNAASAGPRRLLDVNFPSDGSALYVVDYGVMLVDKNGITAKPGTGVVWRITRKESENAKDNAGTTSEAKSPK